LISSTIVFLGGTNILAWTGFGIEKDIYISNLALTLTNHTTKSPVYYVSVKATNGADIYLACLHPPQR
jgi:hypothetical protein